MDVGGLLRQARVRAGLSQRQLAQRADTSRSALHAYETGQVSPTARTLDRLLAACGLQARVQLEPLLADVDARVDAMLAAAVSLDVEELASIARGLNDEPGGPGFPGARRPRGPLGWAFDGAVALQLQGLAAPGPRPAGVVIEESDAARLWLRDTGAMSPLRPSISWIGADLAEVQGALQEPIFTLAAFLRVRLVEVLPSAISIITPPGTSRPVPVLTVEEVERAHPEHAEVLARWRSRVRPDVA